MTPATGIILIIICILLFAGVVGYFFSWLVKREILKILAQSEGTTERSGRSGHSGRLGTIRLSERTEPLETAASGRIEIIKLSQPVNSPV